MSGKYRIEKRVSHRRNFNDTLTDEVEGINIEGADPVTGLGVKASVAPGSWEVADPKNNIFPTNEEGERQLFHATPSKLVTLYGHEDVPNRLLQQVLAVARAEALKHGTGQLTNASITTPYSAQVSLNALKRGDIIENPYNNRESLERQVRNAHHKESSREAGNEIGASVGSHILRYGSPEYAVSSEELSQAMGDSYRARRRTKQTMKPSESELGAAQDDAMAEYVRRQQATANDKDLFGEPLDPRSLATSQADVRQQPIAQRQETSAARDTTPSTPSAVTYPWQDESLPLHERTQLMVQHLERLTQRLDQHTANLINLRNGGSNNE